MLQILTRYKVVPEFLEVLFSFGSDPHLAEAGNSNLAVVDLDGTKRMSIFNLFCGGTHALLDTCYQFRYAEENNRAPATPWSIRQTGVYHQHSAQFDLWILLNPVDKSVLERQLELLEETRHIAALQKLRDDPFRLHSLVCESYVHNWRWYIRFLGKQFEGKVSQILQADRAPLTLYRMIPHSS
jgi:hypothetical protein